MKYHTSLHIRQALREACKQAGSQKAWAIKHNLAGSYVTDVLMGRREPGHSILQALGFERVTVYRKATAKE